jgi:hypothetical protein
MRNLFFVALPRPTGGPLRTPAQSDEQFPYVAGMIAHAKLALDQVGHPWTGPQWGLVAQPLGTAPQQGRQTLAVPDAQTWLALGAPRFPQPGFALAAILLHPASYRLTNHLELAGDGGRSLATFPQTDSFKTTLLQLFKIATHSRRVSHTSFDAANSG